MNPYESRSGTYAHFLVSPKFVGTVRMLLLKRIKSMFMRM